MTNYNHSPPWLRVEDDRLLRLLANGEPWSFIIKLMVGRTRAACQNRASMLRRQVREAARAAGQEPEKWTASVRKSRVVVPDCVIRQAKTETVIGRVTSTSKLVVDAELRARIEAVGITAGLLGDPMPGRSALDKRKLGAVG